MLNNGRSQEAIKLGKRSYSQLRTLGGRDIILNSYEKKKPNPTNPIKKLKKSNFHFTARSTQTSSGNWHHAKLIRVEVDTTGECLPNIKIGNLSQKLGDLNGKPKQQNSLPS